MDHPNHQQRMALRDKILALDKNDWISICTCILIPNEETITIKKSGVFFCMMALSDKSITDIQNYISHKNKIK